MTDVSLNAKEQAAADAILAVMAAIKDLAEDGSNVYNFNEEAIPAVHTLQMFVLMHWAHRIHPEYWSDWFESPGWYNELKCHKDAMSGH